MIKINFHRTYPLPFILFITFGMFFFLSNLLSGASLTNYKNIPKSPTNTSETLLWQKEILQTIDRLNQQQPQLQLKIHPSSDLSKKNRELINSQLKTLELILTRRHQFTQRELLTLSCNHIACG